ASRTVYIKSSPGYWHKMGDVAGFLPNASVHFSEAPSASCCQKRKWENVIPKMRNAASSPLPPCLEETPRLGSLQAQAPKQNATLQFMHFCCPGTGRTNSMAAGASKRPTLHNIS
uniref:Uncharacterized protein n=1 Tax=Apteryx owenii TaxID=8824 RepID=A0A8B9Q7G9_APTOW